MAEEIQLEKETPPLVVPDISSELPHSTVPFFQVK